METTLQGTATRPRVRVIQVLFLIGAAGVLTAALVTSALSARDSSATSGAHQFGLTAQQIVIRGEVADRTGSPSGLSAQQIVTRGEVADRNNE